LDEINCVAASIWITLFFKNYTSGSNPTTINNYIKQAAEQYLASDSDSFGYGFDSIPTDTMIELIAITECLVCVTGD
jgi:hypothetical protein